MLSRFSNIVRVPSRRLIHTTSAAKFAEKAPAHTADTYSKDVDTSPPKDGAVHTVGDAGVHVQRPADAPTQYAHVSETEPYTAKGAEGKEYGSTGGVSPPSGSEQGPAGTNQGGRKPEGR
ncbi:hypothetical protein PLICRDRAFT_169266 [Plicaturopsis crispa FD-325 SS-3]|nr:hypothetical protein PLICRDRAFT_169266 [Plicaturopsis crispa FD-325 SS-3]